MRSLCPETTIPKCAVGEVAEISNAGECCPSYKCVCVESTCPEPIVKCSHGFKIKVRITGDQQITEFIFVKTGDTL